jgi:hypothetical protein
MSTIGGPGGIGGPKGPDGPDGPTGADALEDAAGTAEAASVEAAGHGTVVDGLAAEIAAGRMTPREAVDRLVDLTAGPELGAAERAELREMLTELVANDPYLGGLVGRI